MEDLSEQAIRENCPHCDTTSQAFRYKLKETKDFYILVDSHPIVVGHLLIIPKKHLSCIGEYSPDMLDSFKKLHQKIMTFMSVTYRKVSWFEHGILGQTVFHSHVHYLPFAGDPTDIVPEGQEYLNETEGVAGLPEVFTKEKGYLVFGLGIKTWIVDKKLAAPRFFRDRFASALNRAERGNWKEMHINKELTNEAHKDALETIEAWKKGTK